LVHRFAWDTSIIPLRRNLSIQGRDGFPSPARIKKGVIDSPSEEVVIEILRKIDIEVTEDVKIIPIVFA